MGLRIIDRCEHRVIGIEAQKAAALLVETENWTARRGVPVDVRSFLDHYWEVLQQISTPDKSKTIEVADAIRAQHFSPHHTIDIATVLELLDEP